MMDKSGALDVRGLSCPEPVVRTKKALAANTGNLTILTDNNVSVENIRRFATGSGYSFSVEQNDNEYIISISNK